MADPVAPLPASPMSPENLAAWRAGFQKGYEVGRGPSPSSQAAALPRLTSPVSGKLLLGLMAALLLSGTLAAVAASHRESRA